MVQTDHRCWATVLSCVIVISILLTGCAATPTNPPPIEVSPNPISQVSSNNNTYVNLMVNSVNFMGTVSDGGDTGDLQLIIITSDDSGHADAHICPYGAVMPVHTGDQVNPCLSGISYQEDLIQNHLYVVFIAMDVKDPSALADIGTSALSSGLSLGMEAAIVAITGIQPETAIATVGFLALDTVVGYAGDKVKQYFLKNYVIGSQSFMLSRKHQWNNGQPISANSTNGQVAFTFSARRSSTAQGQIVLIGPSTDLTSVPSVTLEVKTVYDAFTDFSPTYNPPPGSVWTYGYSWTLGGPFDIYKKLTHDIDRQETSLWTRPENYLTPNVSKNISGKDVIDVDGCIVHPASVYLHMHPGENNEFSVVRWTTPINGTYQIDSAFRSLRFCTEPTTTDAHVLDNSTPIYNVNINEYMSAGEHVFSKTLDLHAGDTIDFVVGVGDDGNYGYDSTGLRATIKFISGG